MNEEVFATKLAEEVHAALVATEKGSSWVPRVDAVAEISVFIVIIVCTFFVVVFVGTRVAKMVYVVHVDDVTPNVTNSYIVATSNLVNLV